MARDAFDPRLKLQASDVSLLHLADTQPFPGTKVEVLARIRALVALDFAQFTRAVFLAENEFTDADTRPISEFHLTPADALMSRRG